MKTCHSSNPRNNQAGFSLVDIMVGMVLSLLGTIVIFQVFSVSESIKRTTTSGGEAQQNGVAGLFMLQRAVKTAGYGINANDVNPTPVQITVGAGGTPDTITVSYRQNWDYGAFAPNNLAFVSAVPPALTFETYSINNGQLRKDSLPAAADDGILVEGIAQIKAQYGTDADMDGIVSNAEWVTTPPFNPMRVLAMRLALVARSAQPGKADPGTGLCNTTTAFPAWIGGAVDLSGNSGLAVGDQWQCFRYKIFEVTVPLRNVIWRP